MLSSRPPNTSQRAGQSSATGTLATRHRAALQILTDDQEHCVKILPDKKHAMIGRVFALEPPSRLELETRRLRSGCSTD